jgi:hypothetical protein
MIIDDISRFSDLQEVADAVAGKYAKDYQRDYKLTLVKNVCMINTVNDCTIKNLPDHYAFSFHDDDGWHTVNENINEISVKGVSCFFFTIKNT